MKAGKKISILLRLLVGLGLLTFLFKKVSWGESLSIIRNINLFYLVLIFLSSFFLISISCFKWQILLKARGIKIPLSKLIVLYVIGYFFNNFMPGSVGGDAIRGFVLGKRIKSQVEAFASVFMERFTGLIALVGIALTVSLVNYRMLKELWLASFLTIVLIGLIISLLLIFSRKLFLKIRPHLSPAPPRACVVARSKEGGHLWKIRERLVEFYEAIHSFKTGKVMGSTLLISLVFYLMASVNVFVASLALGVDIQIIDIFLVVPLILLIMMIPISIAGWGLWEGGFVYFFTRMGVPAPEALSIALVLRAKNLIVALIGGIIFSLKYSKEKE